MKILFLQDDFPPISFGGAGISTYELALGMKKEGHEIFIITTCRKESESGETEYKGLRVFKIASDYALRWRMYRSLYNPGVVRRVESLLKEIQPDVVHINNVHAHLSYHCFKISKKYAKAVVFTARDTMSICYGKLRTERYLKNLDCRTTWREDIREAKKRYNPFHNFFTKRYLAYADKRYAVSNALRKALVENGIENVDVQHTGADVEGWSASEDEKIIFRKRFGVENKKVILFGGRLSEGKGGISAIKALALIHREVPDAVLLVAGSTDPFTERMKEEAATLGVGEKLIITGWIESDKIRVAHAIADVVLVPSLYLDPFPRLVIEAMASGKPVVGTCYGGAPEIILDGVTGYVVNPLYAEEIATKIVELFKNPQKAEQFGKAGFERIRKDFSLEGVIKKYIVVYESVLHTYKTKLL